MVSVLRTLSLAAQLTAATTSERTEPARSPAVSAGFYQAGRLGRLQLSMKEGQVEGVTLEVGGACSFDRYRKVLRGTLQGQVLVGSLTLCLEGASCPRTRRFPILAFFNPESRSLAAQVRLPEGCRSPALEGSLWALAPEPPGTTRSERERPESRRNSRAAERALERAQRLLEVGSWAEAAQHFEESIEYDDSNWLTHLGLGITQLERGQARAAVESLERALALAPQDRSQLGHYQLARAYGRLGDREHALASLRQAVERDYPLSASPLDEGLQSLLGSDPEYARLRQQAAGGSKPGGQRSQTGP